jgi:hypothetical protein
MDEAFMYFEAPPETVDANLDDVVAAARTAVYF